MAGARRRPESSVGAVATPVARDAEAPFDVAGFLGTLTHRPGVYRMLDAGGLVLYVGKARDLRRRVGSYFGRSAHHPKTQALMAQTRRVEVTITQTEQEALLLEYNLIKEHRPRFNVLLRDDKSYPYIYVSTHQSFPRMQFHRGARRGPGEFYGPFPGAGAVRDNLARIQKLFRVRQCTDSFFANRSRPCLQHQLGRCSAPCVGLVSEADYRQDVDDAIQFLRGRNDVVLASLVARMEEASAALAYERAAGFRDQIAAIRRLQSEQIVARRGGDADVLAVTSGRGVTCVALLVVRGGRMLGSRTFFPRTVAGTEPDEVVSAFIGQHYFVQPSPAEILVPCVVPEREALEAVLGSRASHPVRIRERVRGARRRWLDLAQDNAAQGLATRLAQKASLQEQLEQLGEVLGLPGPPSRIECFDISHTSGRETVASCVVFGSEGPLKSDYRRFNIGEAPAGDDYAAIGEAVRRRYTRVRRGESPVPDLVLIDGGQGQLGRAVEVLAELGMREVPVAAVAKGRDRRPGDERVFLPGARVPLGFRSDSPALLLIQQVRDEAHRFAITGHRQRRGRARQESVLDGIDGLGPVRRRALLRQLGGLAGIRQAGVADLGKVEGISESLARRIYARLHDDE